MSAFFQGLILKMTKYKYNKNNALINRGVNMIKKCYKCHGKLEKAIKLINYKGRSTFLNTFECKKCETTFTPLNEAEKARLDLNPSFFERLKYLFLGFNEATEAILKGKVL